jgi:glycosyltransferase involved in cell wall biosynthesis
MTLSIAIITYNHEHYIREALDSILMQKTDFDFEIIIGDDSSTDATPTICEEYASKHANIKYERYAVNGGISSNWIKTISRCTGIYVALLEGDDFWTAPEKLQTQVDFLNDNNQYVFCYHGFDIKQQDNSRAYHNFRNELNTEKKSISFQDALQTCYPQTLTVVFRNGNYNLQLLLGLNVCDRFFYQLLLLNADGYYINSVMGSYRIHAAQVTFVQKEEKARYIDGILFWERLALCDISSVQKNALNYFITKAYFNIYTAHSKGIFNAYLKKGLVFYLKTLVSKKKIVVKNRIKLSTIIWFLFNKMRVKSKAND